MNDLKLHIGLSIKSFRLANGFTQSELAEKVDISNEAISNIERGINFPSFNTLMNIAHIFGCDISDLVARPNAREDSLRSKMETEILARLKSLPDDKLEIFLKIINALA